METINREENFFNCNILMEIRGDYVHDIRTGKNRLLLKGMENNKKV